ncbi:hypothetical protein AX14_014087 [Amanita brunnescens Koide BX004]|nr:hypothetical protein AX14_014087 [Amanita brunnescens Koide BX004]
MAHMALPPTLTVADLIEVINELSNTKPSAESIIAALATKPLVTGKKSQLEDVPVDASLPSDTVAVDRGAITTLASRHDPLCAQSIKTATPTRPSGMSYTTTTPTCPSGMSYTTTTPTHPSGMSYTTTTPTRPSGAIYGTTTASVRSPGDYPFPW